MNLLCTGTLRCDAGLILTPSSQNTLRPPNPKANSKTATVNDFVMKINGYPTRVQSHFYLLISIYKLGGIRNMHECHLKTIRQYILVILYCSF